VRPPDAPFPTIRFTNNADDSPLDHPFLPQLWLNELRLNGAGWRWKDLQNNPNGPWGLPTVIISQGEHEPQHWVLSNPAHPGSGFGIGRSQELLTQWTYAAKDVLDEDQGEATR